MRSDEATKGPLVHEQTRSAKLQRTRFPVNTARSARWQENVFFSSGHWEPVLTPSHNGLSAVVNIDLVDPNYLVWATA